MLGWEGTVREVEDWASMAGAGNQVPALVTAGWGQILEPPQSSGHILHESWEEMAFL